MTDAVNDSISTNVKRLIGEKWTRDDVVRTARLANLLAEQPFPDTIYRTLKIVVLRERMESR